MTATDVADLSKSKLAEASFPAPRAAEFRVFLAATVHQGIWRHAEENQSVEVCGVLVGKWATDVDGPYASVTEYIRCDGATQKFAEVTFTHESWTQINKEMDTKYADLRVIGWYHTHPNFGIFLSDRDNFIQQHFFSDPGNIALVVDPVRKIEGIFIWRRGKTAPLSHYWVGDRILSGAPTTNDGVERAVDPTKPTPTAATPPRMSGESLSLVMLAIAGLCLFQFGFMSSGMLSRWQQAKIEEGAVSHYGIWKIYKPGFEELITELARLEETNRQDIKRLVAALPPPPDEKLAEASKKSWAELDRRMAEARDVTMRIGQVYGLNEQEKQQMLKLIAEKLVVRDATTPKAGATPTAAPSSTAVPQATAPQPSASQTSPTPVASAPSTASPTAAPPPSK